SGEIPKPGNIARLRDALCAMRRLRRPSSTETRLALLTYLDGKTPFDLLKSQQWVSAIAAMEKVPPIPLPPSDHRDMHPVAFLGALTDRPAPTSGRIFAGRSRRIPRGAP